MHRPQGVDVLRHGGVDRGGVRELRHVEGGQDVAQRDGRDQTAGDVLRALEGIAVEIEECVGQLGERRRRGRDLQTAEARHDVPRPQNRLGDRPVGDAAVGREGLSGRRRVDGQRDALGVGQVRFVDGEGGRLECGGARHRRDGREAHFDPIAVRHDHAHRDGRLAAISRGLGRVAQGEVVRAHDDVDLPLGPAQVLHDHGQLEGVAEVQEARRGRAHGERQSGRDVRLA